MPNAQVAVVDRRGRAVPIGVAGELCLGGDGVARGYLGHPRTTAEKFIPNPDPRNAGGRLFRTGDLARVLADGNLEFLGRIDQQVKIRGFRVEPGEVEAVLAQHPGVRVAVVVAREEGGVYRLVGYAVPRDGEPALSAAAVREFLAAAVPDHMVPDAFLLRPDLPRTPSGKIDRRALPAVSADGVGADHGYVPPETETEELLAAIFAEVLARGCGRRSEVLPHPRQDLRNVGHLMGGEGVQGYSRTGTIFASRIAWSRVRRVAPRTRAVATMMRSAGSRWNLSGKVATSAAIVGEMPTRRTRGGAVAFSSHSRNGSRSSIRPRLWSVAISQSEISDSHKGLSASELSRTAR